MKVIEAIYKILEIFLIDNSLIDPMSRYMSWVENESFSDYSPVILELDHVLQKILYTFNFNHMWLEEQDFKDMVRLEWENTGVREHEQTMKILVRKLRSLKHYVIKWERKR